MCRYEHLQSAVLGMSPVPKASRQSRLKLAMKRRLRLLNGPDCSLTPAEIAAVVCVQSVQDLVEKERLVTSAPVFILTTTTMVASSLEPRHREHFTQRSRGHRWLSHRRSRRLQGRGCAPQHPCGGVGQLLHQLPRRGLILHSPED